MNWDADLDGPPIMLPDGRKVETLAECRAYILAMPKAEQARWEGVAGQLLKAAEHGGPFLFIARVSFARALHGVKGVGPAPARRDESAAWKAKRSERKKKP